MKRAIKTALAITGLVAVPVFVNQYIFTRANLKRVSKSNELYYESRHGDVRYIKEGNGEPLLLVHGIGAGVNLYEWERSIKSLSKHYTVYALDLLGMGFSDKPQMTYSSYFFITLINSFIKDVIGESTNIIASSNSGAYAVMAYCFEPELFKKIMLISPTGVGDTKSAVKPTDLIAKWIIDSPVLGTSIYNAVCSRAYIKWFLENKCYADKSAVTPELVDKYYHASHYGGANAKYIFGAFISKFLDVNIDYKLSKIAIPVHIIWGEENDLNRLYNYREIKKANDKISLTVFEGAKLLPHVENPKAFYSECRKFFG